jgi:hypothetical protein
MAKKKAAKKKPAQKKTAKKTSARKTAQKRSAPKDVTITFKCANGCTAQDDPAHAGRGALVYLEAKDTDAYLWFVKKSPFKSGHKQIEVLNGKTVKEVVDDGADGEYEYLLDCKNPGCRSPVNNPKMIVP